MVLPYAAYLRIYEPLVAFAEPERSRWAEYAASPDRAARASALETEHEEAIRRLIAVPPIIAPARESEHAYVRQLDGFVYVCPWQIRLRSWLALGRLRAALPPALTDTFVPRQFAELAAADFARWHARSPSIRTHILTATWQVPLAWFVPFGPPERWLVLGGGAGGDGGPATAAATRTLIYLTTMAQARRRVARALGAVRRGHSRGSRPYADENPPYGGGGPHRRPPPGTAPSPGSVPPGPVPRRGGGRHAAGHSDGDAARRGGGQRRKAAPRHAAGASQDAPGRNAVPPGIALPAAEIEEVGLWLEEFHPRALVELDYGGLVHLMPDETLRADQSAAEVAAAITGLETGELELAVAMYQRLRSRWAAMRDAESLS